MAMARREAQDLRRACAACPTLEGVAIASMLKVYLYESKRSRPSASTIAYDAWRPSASCRTASSIQEQLMDPARAQGEMADQEPDFNILGHSILEDPMDQGSRTGRAGDHTAQES